MACPASRIGGFSVERRLAQLQNDTCTLFWGTNLITQSGADSFHPVTHIAPTNFPTPKLRIYFNDTLVTNVLFTTKKNWNPGRRVEIFFVPLRATQGGYPENTNRYTMFSAAEGVGTGSIINSLSNYREFRLCWEPDCSNWESILFQSTAFPYQFTTNGSRLTPGDFSPTAPATVEDWLALHQEWASP